MWPQLRPPPLNRHTRREYTRSVLSSSRGQPGALPRRCRTPQWRGCSPVPSTMTSYSFAISSMAWGLRRRIWWSDICKNEQVRLGRWQWDEGRQRNGEWVWGRSDCVGVGSWPGVLWTRRPHTSFAAANGVSASLCTVSSLLCPFGLKGLCPELSLMGRPD